MFVIDYCNDLYSMFVVDRIEVIQTVGLSLTVLKG